MQKIAIVVVSFVIFLTACTSGTSVTTIVNSSDTLRSTEQSFCPKIERESLDFDVLNDLMDLLKKKSIFNETASDRVFVFKKVHESLWASLDVAKKNIPQWSHDIISEEIKNNKKPDFRVLNTIIQKAAKLDEYRELRNPTRLELMLQDIIRGTIKALRDPFTLYRSANQWALTKEEAKGISGQFLGVGIQPKINSRNEVVIAGITKGGPAEKSDLRLGDAVTHVNGLSVLDCTMGEFISHVKIAGAKNPNLMLTVARERIDSREREILQISLTMEIVRSIHIKVYPEIQWPDNRGSSLEGLRYRCGDLGGSGLSCPFKNIGMNIVYIQIDQFSNVARDDLLYAFEELDRIYGLDTFDGFIFDVVDNPGGRVDATIDMIDFILPGSDIIFTEVNIEGEIISRRQNKFNYIDPDIPVAVLMNDQSASGAEVFASALRDNGRATIFNRFNRSNGKGTINLWFELKKGTYGAVYVSYAYWTTPNGEIVEKIDLDNDGYYEVGGVKPDVQIAWLRDDITRNTRDVNYDPTLQAAIDWIKKNKK